MSNLDRLVEKLGRYFSSTHDLLRAIWIVLAILAFSVVAFGGYYYWDRYVRPGDKSPLERSIAQLEEAIRQDPHDPDLRVALAEFYLNKGMYPQAIDQTSEVLGLYPEHEGALLINGLAHVRTDQREMALVSLANFVDLRKGRPTAKVDTRLEMAYYFLGESYVALGRPEEAIPALEAALAISSIDADALYQLGRAYHATGQIERALERYHKAVRLVPSFGEAYSGMVESYSHLEQPDHVAYARGMQAFCVEDYETARTHLEHAAQALPDFAPAFLGLGLAYEQMGDPSAAMGAMERALELNPRDFAAQQAYGRIQAATGAQE